jgi:hypothetical protein
VNWISLIQVHVEAGEKLQAGIYLCGRSLWGTLIPLLHLQMCSSPVMLRRILCFCRAEVKNTWEITKKFPNRLLCIMGLNFVSKMLKFRVTKYEIPMRRIWKQAHLTDLGQSPLFVILATFLHSYVQHIKTGRKHNCDTTVFLTEHPLSHFTVVDELQLMTLEVAWSMQLGKTMLLIGWGNVFDLSPCC